MPTPPTDESITKLAEAEFQKLVGYCITTWAEVEEKLFQICWKALQCPKGQAAIVYYRSPTLDTRVKLTDELVRSILPKRERKSGGHDHTSVTAWKEIMDQFEKLLPTRNRIAHHPTTDRKFNVEIGMLAGYSWFEIYVSEAEKLRGRSDHLQPLLMGDLTAHHILTLGLASWLERFYLETLLKHVR